MTCARSLRGAASDPACGSEPHPAVWRPKSTSAGRPAAPPRRFGRLRRARAAASRTASETKHGCRGGGPPRAPRPRSRTSIRPGRSLAPLLVLPPVGPRLRQRQMRRGHGCHLTRTSHLCLRRTGLLCAPHSPLPRQCIQQLPPATIPFCSCVSRAHPGNFRLRRKICWVWQVCAWKYRDGADVMVSVCASDSTAPPVCRSSGLPPVGISAVAVDACAQAYSRCNPTRVTHEARSLTRCFGWLSPSLASSVGSLQCCTLESHGRPVSVLVSDHALDRTSSMPTSECGCACALLLMRVAAHVCGCSCVWLHMRVRLLATGNAWVAHAEL